MGSPSTVLNPEPEFHKQHSLSALCLLGVPRMQTVQKPAGVGWKMPSRERRSWEFNSQESQLLLSSQQLVSPSLCPGTLSPTAPSWAGHGAEGETLSEEGASRCPHLPRALQPWAPRVPAAPVWKRSAFADGIDLEQQLGAASKGGFYGFTWRGKSPESENTAPTGTATSAGDPHPAGTELVPAMATWLQLSGEQGQAERPGRA